MEKLVAYKRMPLWNKETMPEAVQQKHNTKVGTWGKITVLKGTLKFIELTEDGEVLAEHLFEAGADNPMAQPQAHGTTTSLAPSGGSYRRCGMVLGVLL